MEIGYNMINVGENGQIKWNNLNNVKRIDLGVDSLAQKSWELTIPK